MPRAHRISCPGLIWHITHRCHQKSFLLRFARDRRRWRHWLFKAQRRYGLSVLNYIATSNHIHLLVADGGQGEISKSMQLVAGRVAQEYNRRKSRRGAFWEDRYHATAVQSGRHLLRCMTYIDLNMVRAGVVRHPADWHDSGYVEIQSPWQRKGVIDFAKLLELLDEKSVKSLAHRLRMCAEENVTTTVRQKLWTTAVGIGDEAFIRQLRTRLDVVPGRRKEAPFGSSIALHEPSALYISFSGTKRPI